jgi:Xaa-Pro aminopeptidase
MPTVSRLAPADPLLIYGATDRSPALRHEIPLTIIDPFLWARVDGREIAVLNVLEVDRVLAAVPNLEALAPEELGWDELLASGRPRPEIELELAERAVRHIGLAEAIVPAEFPVALADRLRDAGVTLRPDYAVFEERRRVKTEAELAGIRRAQRAAEAGMAAAAALLREAGDGTHTAEQVRAAIREACAAHGAPAPPDIIVGAGGQGAAGHESGSGPLPASTPIIVDVWPQDEASGCWADMTRTFVIGDVPGEVAEQHRLTLDALRRTTAATRAGVRGIDVYDIACEIYEAAGHPTQRTKKAGEVLRDGFFHGLGHGVGLEVHEAPGLGRSGAAPLVAGDVVTLEPGTYRSGYGGVRLEDLVIVTDDGCEVLTDYPYDLAP